MTLGGERFEQLGRVMHEPTGAIQAGRLVRLFLHDVADDHGGKRLVDELGNLIGAPGACFAEFGQRFLHRFEIEGEAEHA